MTPDELRRMDNELCIIFEKGLKPIKANKFYYFRNQNMNRRLNQNRLDHNNFDSGVRGEWRKFNPQNPYTDATDKPEQDLKVESLVDLFEDNSDNKKQNFKNNVDNYENDEDEVFIGRDLAHAKSHSELISGKIDTEVKDIVDDCYRKAKEIILEHMDVLNRCAELLLVKEKIGREEFEALFDGKEKPVPE